jgi:hypothetical protein
MKKIIIIFLCLCFILPISVFASDTITTLQSSKIRTEINKDSIRLSTIDTKFDVLSSIYIDDIKFSPISIATKSQIIELDTTKTKLEYTFSEKKLKEVITLKEAQNIKFEVLLKNGNKLIQWDNGQFKIIESNSINNMQGIILLKPYGIDANGNYIEMNYLQNGNILSLNYNKQIKVFNESYKILEDEKGYNPSLAFKFIDIKYPLIIDPTWEYVADHYETTVDSDVIIMWNTTGSTSYTIPNGVTSIWYLVVAAGGAGGGDATGNSGGGGAGGLLNGTIDIVGGTTYNITVGAGGNSDGANSTFFNTTITTLINAKGGGRGGYYGSAGRNGGSGGGGASSASGSGHIRGLGIEGQGFNGSNGTGSVGDVSAGSGGGAGALGGSNGGVGLQINITGLLTYYAGGGGRGHSGNSIDNGGAGGGGKGGYGTSGSPQNAVAGTNGLGGGGGGSGYYAPSVAGTGGSGIVIIRFTNISPDIIPPASITNLTNNTATCQEVNFTWTNPTDADYGGLQYWFNNTLQSPNLTNSDTFKLFTGLNSGTSYTFSTKTFDNSSNSNTTFVNMTAIASSCITPTPTPTDLQICDIPIISSLVNTSFIKWEWNDSITSISFNGLNVSDFDYNSSIFIKSDLTKNTRYTLKIYNNSGHCGRNITYTLDEVIPITPISEEETFFSTTNLYILFFFALLCLIIGFFIIPVIGFGSVLFGIIGLLYSMGNSFIMGLLFVIVIIAGFLIGLRSEI